MHCFSLTVQLTRILSIGTLIWLSAAAAVTATLHDRYVESHSALVRGRVTFKCHTKTHDPAPDWTFDREQGREPEDVARQGLLIDEWTTKAKIYVFADVGSCTLEIVDVSTEDAGIYQCIEDAGAGDIHSFRLTVKAPAYISSTYYIREGISIMLPCFADLPGKWQYQKYHKPIAALTMPDEITRDENLMNGWKSIAEIKPIMSSDNSLIILKTPSIKSGIYTCVVDGAKYEHILNISGDARDIISIETPANWYAAFMCQFPNVSVIRWYHQSHYSNYTRGQMIFNGYKIIKLPDRFRVFTSNTSGRSVLLINGTTQADTGMYRCEPLHTPRNSQQYGLRVRADALEIAESHPTTERHKTTTLRSGANISAADAPKASTSHLTTKQHPTTVLLAVEVPEVAESHTTTKRHQATIGLRDANDGEKMWKKSISMLYILLVLAFAVLFLVICYLCRQRMRTRSRSSSESKSLLRNVVTRSVTPTSNAESTQNASCNMKVDVAEGKDQTLPLLPGGDANSALKGDDRVQNDSLQVLSLDETDKETDERETGQPDKSTTDICRISFSELSHVALHDQDDFRDVYRAQHPQLGVVIYEELKDGDPNKSRLIMDEICARPLSHPNIVKMIGVICDPDHVGFVSEMVTSLRNFIDNTEKKQDWPVKLHFALDVLHGLRYLHTRELPVIHGSLKLCNVFVRIGESSPVAKICYPIKMIWRKTLVNCESFTESPTYSPPEILTGQESFSVKSDIYSLGILLWELFSDKKPFRKCGVKTDLIRSAVIDGQRPPLDKIKGPETGKIIVQDIIEHCWDNDPQRRMSVDGIHNALTDALTSLTK